VVTSRSGVGATVAQPLCASAPARTNPKAIRCARMVGLVCDLSSVYQDRAVRPVRHPDETYPVGAKRSSAAEGHSRTGDVLLVNWTETDPDPVPATSFPENHLVAKGSVCEKVNHDVRRAEADVLASVPPVAAHGPATNVRDSLVVDPVDLVHVPAER
jgi:hypothetical protein